MTVTEMIRERLATLAPEQIELIDDSAKHAGHAGARDGGGHFHLRIVASAFTGLRIMQRHRLVYDALGPLMKREIHALSIEAFAPGER
jgi:BolA protein